MEYMTLKQYAESRGITYEAVRRTVQKYRQQLGEHIIRKQNTQLLDEEAVAFLNERRRQSRVVVIRENNEDEIRALQSEVTALRDKLVAAQDEIMNLQAELLKTKDHASSLYEAKVRYDLLLVDHERTEADLERTRADLDQVKVELDQARATAEQTQTQLELARIDKEAAEKEAGSYHKSWFGFYRKD